MSQHESIDGPTRLSEAGQAEPRTGCCRAAVRTAEAVGRALQCAWPDASQARRMAESLRVSISVRLLTATLVALAVGLLLGRITRSSIRATGEQK